MQKSFIQENIKRKNLLRNQHAFEPRFLFAALSSDTAVSGFRELGHLSLLPILGTKVVMASEGPFCFSQQSLFVKEIPEIFNWLSMARILSNKGSIKNSGSQKSPAIGR